MKVYIGVPRSVEVENGTGTAEIDRQIIPNTNRIIRFGWLKCELKSSVGS